MTAVAVLFFGCYFLNKYAEFLGDQPVGQLNNSVMRTSAAEKSVSLVDYSFQ